MIKQTEISTMMVNIQAEKEATQSQRQKDAFDD